METIRLGREAAIKKYETRWWEGKTAREIAIVQLQIEELICPISIFKQSLSEALGRPVATHNLGTHGAERMWEELTRGTE